MIGKMWRTKNKLLLIFIVLFSLSLFCFSRVAFVTQADDGLGEVALKTEYDMYENVAIPEAKVTVGGVEYNTEVIVVYPSGSAYKTMNVNTFEEGEYRVQYRATVDGELKIFEKTFTVSNSLYSYSLSSEVEYGSYNAAEHDPNNIGTIGTVEGLKVSLSGGDTFKYNRAINLNDYSESDILLTFCVTPQVIGVADTFDFYVYLTDAYDSTNVIKIYSRLPSSNYTEYGNSYLAAKAFDSMKYTGWEWNFKTKHSGDNYGFPYGLNTAGYMNNAYLHDIRDNTFNISFNYAEKTLHNPVHASSGNVTTVCDFDNPRDFSQLWDGFTTGECYISIYCENDFNFVITKLGKQDLNDDAFTNRDPVTQIAFGDYDKDNLPNAVVGCPYGVFEANCLSPYFGNLDVTARVYRNYGEDNQYEVLVRDGKFIPEKPGKYYLCYEVKEYFGKVSKSEVYQITAKSPDGVLPMQFDFTGVDIPEQGCVGDFVEVSSPIVENPCGNAVIKKYIEYNGIKEEFQNGFRPTKSGRYKIVFRAIDHSGREYYERFNFIALSGDTPVFIDEAKFPDYFISGATYSLPVLNAYNYVDGSREEVKATVTVIDDDGQRIIRTGTIVPVARESGRDTLVRYTASLNGGNKVVKEYRIPTIVAERNDALIMKNYFYASEGRINYSESGEFSTYYTISEDTKLDFAKCVIADGFTFKFGSMKNYVNFSAINIYVTDSENKKESVKLTYSIKGNSVEFTVNDGNIIYPVTQMFDSDDEFTLQYLSQNLAFSYDTLLKGNLAKIKNTVNGDVFNGFSSGKITFSLEVEGVTSLTKIRIDSVNRQLISNDDMDYVGPDISVLGVCGGMYRLGEEITLANVICEDVLQPSAKIYMSAEGPDGSYLLSTDGIMLEDVEVQQYKIKLDAIGSYIMTYTAYDSANRRSTFSYIVMVLDREAPVIKVTSDISKSYSLGETVYLSGATATDNVTEDLEVKVYVETRNGVMFEVKNQNGYAFKPLSVGEYKIIYWAVDEQGNMGTYTFTITVS